MMRSWGNRRDTFVTDEPLYAHYLKQTGLPHPGADEVIRHQENDWRKVVAWLTGPVPGGRPVWYQKQMAHHLLADIDTAWLDELTNCFLIRDPAEMIASLVEFIPRPTLLDTGLPQQVELFRRVRRQTGSVPPVVDAQDVQNHPRDVLSKLCGALGLEFDEAMLQWPPGLRETDGVWAKHWYDKVAVTTGFQPHAAKRAPIPKALAELAEQGTRLYDELHSQRIEA
jgi:hypothetical protein